MKTNETKCKEILSLVSLYFKSNKTTENDIIEIMLNVSNNVIINVTNSYEELLNYLTQNVEQAFTHAKLEEIQSV